MTCKFYDQKDPDFPYYHFSAAGFSCKIVPAFGGSIQELVVNNKPIIEGVTSNKAGQKKYLQMCNSAILFPFPNRIKHGRYRFMDKTHSLPVNEPTNNNAIHGIVYTKSFKVISFTENSISLSYIHQGSTGFPFPFSIELHYTFYLQNIELKVLVRNTGDSSFPFGIGWHPYFHTEDQSETIIRFSSDTIYEVDDQMIPVRSKQEEFKELKLEKAEIDNAFQLNNTDVRLIAPKYKLKLQVPDDSYLQLFTPDHRGSVAIEPISCIADAFNNRIGLKVLQPGKKFSWPLSLKIEKSS
ncbi:hypothetical protein C5O00_07275 [Pukyongia salina]|uniref:Aldose 1-epimerase n=1 Tax=Pukyongia salina TaxID=2094025 RepID=A0A2S0HWI9_9FLAO|nr:hypothetical protein [Pukyongia salina]AVI50986.1 hypothetical protein C5O00_07275 [Pukyongia salina]